MDKALRNPRTIALFILPALVLYTAIVIVPLFISLGFSSLDWDGIREPTFVGTQNYVRLVSAENDGFLKSVFNTLKLTGLTLLIQIPFALLLALILGRGVRGEGLYRTVFFIPVVLSSVVIALLWRRIYDPNFGLLNAVLSGLGFIDSPVAWLGEESTALYAASAPIIWQWIGYHMLILYAAAKAVPGELHEAALIDGCSEAGIARRITIPLMMPVIKICVVLATIGSVKTFDVIFILTNGGPAHASEVPSTLMVTTLFRKLGYGYGSAMAICIVVACLVLTLLIQKLFRTGDETY